MNIKFVQRRNDIVVEQEVLEGKDITDPIIEISKGKWMRFRGKFLKDTVPQYDNWRFRKLNDKEKYNGEERR